MMIIDYSLMALLSVAVGLYTRSGYPSPRLRKWMPLRQNWFGSIFIAGFWAILAAEEGVKAVYPRFYSAHEMTFFWFNDSAVVLGVIAWIMWNLKHEKDGVKQPSSPGTNPP